MRALALFLKALGFSVTGSDRQKSDTLEHLAQKGIDVEIGHSENALATADVIVYTSAIGQSHPVLEKARQLGIPVVKRAVMMGEVMKKYWSIAVCGSHGKTSTTLMLSSIWNQTDQPAALMGGEAEQGHRSGAKVSDSGFLIVEADEYDRSFLSMWPSYVLMTNIDDDHLDIYGNVESIRAAFIEFTEKTPFFGFVVANADDAGVQSIESDIQTKMITYGIRHKAEYRARVLAISETGTTFEVLKGDVKLAELNIHLVGEHFVSNALGAFAMAHALGLDVDKIVSGLSQFKGAKRRMEYKGRANQVTLFDDYAHHPTEVLATVTAVKKMVNRPVKVIFQPHLYSRTQQMAARFAEALSPCDSIFVLPVYAARERPIDGVEGDLIVQAAKAYNNSGAFQFIADGKAALPNVASQLVPGDVCITMGAGDVSTWCSELLSSLEGAHV